MRRPYDGGGDITMTRHPSAIAVSFFSTSRPGATVAANPTSLILSPTRTTSSKIVSNALLRLSSPSRRPASAVAVDAKRFDHGAGVMCRQ